MWLSACAEGFDGFILWLTAFAWTYDPREGGSGYAPFVPWDCQIEALRDLYAAIHDGHDILLDKSRDMGVTIMSLYLLVWCCMFEEQRSFLVASRKEELVDKSGSTDTLFYKIDTVCRMLPAWMLPPAVYQQSRTHMHAGFATGSVIDGESTNGDIGRGGRRTAILLDEFAAVDNAMSVHTSTSRTTNCRIYTSTPKGAGHFDNKGQLRGNCFAAIRFSGACKTLSLHWSQHPTYGAGAKLVTDPTTGRQRWTSDWYEAECRRLGSRVIVAQELDIDYLASGSMFFDSDVLARLRTSGQLYGPKHQGELTYDVDTRVEGQSYRIDNIKWQPDAGRRRLALWCDLIDGRPPQDANYVGFADISNGTGASNSVYRIANTSTREEVAAFVCANTDPAEFARYCVAINKWFGGQIGYVFMGWEANGGQGETFGREVRKCGYPYVLGNPDLTRPWEPTDSRVGWHSDRVKKEILVGELRTAMARGEFITHDAALVDECGLYIYYEAGGIGPSGLVEEKEGARAAHGDRVIAAAGLMLCFKEQPKALPPPPPPPPLHSIAWFDQQEAQRQAAAPSWRR